MFKKKIKEEIEIKEKKRQNEWSKVEGMNEQSGEINKRSHGRRTNEVSQTHVYDIRRNNIC